MKKHYSRHIMTAGIAYIILSLIITAIRSYTIDSFHYQQEQDFSAPSGQMMEPQAETFYFAAASDTGSRNEPIERIVKTVRKSKSKFILHLGDLVQYHNQSHFNWITTELAIKLKGFPFYTIPGNHELSKIDGKVDKHLYKKTFGSTYYWFSYGNTIFIGLDSSESKLDDKQLNWLTDTLKKIRPQFKYCVIFSHVPPINVRKDINHKMDNASSQKFARIIQNHNVNLLLFGHVHYFSESEFAGIPMYTLPSSGQPIRDKIKQYGYVEIKITEDGIEKVKPRYIESGRGQEALEVFMNSVVVRDEVRNTAIGLLGLGIVCCLTAMGIMIFQRYKRRKK